MFRKILYLIPLLLLSFTFVSPVNAIRSVITRTYECNAGPGDGFFTPRVVSWTTATIQQIRSNGTVVDEVLAGTSNDHFSVQGIQLGVAIENVSISSVVSSPSLLTMNVSYDLVYRVGPPGVLIEVRRDRINNSCWHGV